MCVYVQDSSHPEQALQDGRSCCLRQRCQRFRSALEALADCRSALGTTSCGLDVLIRLRSPHSRVQTRCALVDHSVSLRVSCVHRCCHEVLRLPRSIRRDHLEAAHAVKEWQGCVSYCHSPCLASHGSQHGRLQRQMPGMMIVESHIALSTWCLDVVSVCVVRVRAVRLLIAALSHVSEAAATPRDTASRDELVIACRRYTACVRDAALSRQGRCALEAVQPPAKFVRLLAVVLGLAGSWVNSRRYSCFH